MVIILSGDGDLSSDLVVQALQILRYPYARINAYDLLRDDFSIAINSVERVLIVKGKKVPIDNVGVVWHRKFGFYKNSSFYKLSIQHLSSENADNLSKEFSTLLAGVISLFKKKKWVTHPDNISLNKLDVLMKAQELGFQIPESYVLTNKNQLNNLLNDHAIISKSIRDPWILSREENSFTMYTSEIKKNHLSDLPSVFFPSLLQKKILKKYEIRVFCLFDQLYAMAIFSQSDSQTEVDFRRYNWQTPNRFVPYKLPSAVRNKLIKLTKLLGLNCCSADLIRTTDGSYCFLEINPTGQFGMVDFPCNYNLHYKVAEKLINLDRMALKYEKEVL